MTHTVQAPRRARSHAAMVRDFFYHLMTFVFVNGLLVILDRRGGEGDVAIAGLDWAYWVIMFWGFGLAGHAISVFFGDRPVSSDEREREPVD